MRKINWLPVALCLVALVGCQRMRRTQSLHQAAYVGSVSEVSRHLENGADVNGNVRGWTPLALAAGEGHDATVRALLDAGADPEVRGGPPGEMTALETAVEGRHLSTVRLLLDRGASPNGEGESQWPPLVRAAHNNDVAIIRELIDRGAAEDAQILALAAYYAVSEGAAKAYEALVDAGAKPRLFDAAAAGSAKLVARLLDEGADPNGMPGANATPLYAAAGNGHAEITRLLLAAGADPEVGVGVGEGWTALG
ncbi:MAG: hypothetical protein GF393_11840, partial [Armatimonadia bacterium]|nr:hypothetical protein [Armatimonadia bacterium]